MPALAVVTVRVSFVCKLVIVTVASGIAAPVGSVTAPTTEPNKTCAFAGIAMNTDRQTKRDQTQINCPKHFALCFAVIVPPRACDIRTPVQLRWMSSPSSLDYSLMNFIPPAGPRRIVSPLQERCQEHFEL